MSKSNTQKALYVISVFALIVLLLDIHNCSKVSLFYMAPPDGSHWLAFKKIWLGELPFLIFWVAIIISTILKWHYILWFFPIASLGTLHRQLTYIIGYHSYISPFYIPFQLLSLFTSILLISGMIVGVLRFYHIYKERNSKN